MSEKFKGVKQWRLRRMSKASVEEMELGKALSRDYGSGTQEKFRALRVGHGI